MLFTILRHCSAPANRGEHLWRKAPLPIDRSIYTSHYYYLWFFTLHYGTWRGRIWYHRQVLLWKEPKLNSVVDLIRLKWIRDENRDLHLGKYITRCVIRPSCAGWTEWCVAFLIALPSRLWAGDDDNWPAGGGGTRRMYESRTRRAGEDRKLLRRRPRLRFVHKSGGE